MGVDDGQAHELFRSRLDATLPNGSSWEQEGESVSAINAFPDSVLDSTETKLSRRLLRLASHTPLRRLRAVGCVSENARPIHVSERKDVAADDADDSITSIADTFAQASPSLCSSPPPSSSPIGSRVVADSLSPAPITNSDTYSIHTLQSLDGEISPKSSISSVDADSEIQFIADKEEEDEAYSSQTTDLSGPSRLRPTQRNHDIESRAPQTYGRKDRFITARQPQATLKERFILHKPATALAEPEKSWRRHVGRQDPFSVAARTTILPANFIQPLRPVAQVSARPGLVLRARQETPNNTHRQISGSAVWNVGGPGPALGSGSRVISGSQTMTSQGTAAPVYTSKFLEGPKQGDDLCRHEKRLIVALDIDCANKILETPSQATKRDPHLPRQGLNQAESSLTHSTMYTGPIWEDNEWSPKGTMKLLEAPNLRDDFYCSVLAYSPTLRCLAVALANKVYLWDEGRGVKATPPPTERNGSSGSFVSAVAFSSVQGARAILAIARGCGRIVLYSPKERELRFMRFSIPASAAHVSFRPTILRRPSLRHSSFIAENEVFLVGDDCGQVWVYFVEWPNDNDRFLFGWHGAVIMHAKIATHCQQICGISWSHHGDYFVTGGNDNLCCLIQASRILSCDHRPYSPHVLPSDDHHGTVIDFAPAPFPGLTFGKEIVRHQWRLNAAVKAMTFCPWQRGLVAVGGGSNDRRIHFFHTMSGACLAKIDCAAQVTSLIWSTTRREIAATFGFAQPEHPFRIAVYSWPECQQVIAIPWHDECRALFAIPFPGGPRGRRNFNVGSTWSARTAEEGCIVVAGSDGSIKFHEIWCDTKRATGPNAGLLGGSDILEALHGIEKEGMDTIR